MDIIKEFLKKAPSRKELEDALAEAQTNLQFWHDKANFIQTVMRLSFVARFDPEAAPQQAERSPQPAQRQKGQRGRLPTPPCLGDSEMLNPDGECRPCTFLEKCAEKVAESLKGD